jgi:hypothetical protein
MRYPEVVAALVAEIQADSAIISALGGNRIYPSDDAHAGSVPSIGYTEITDTEDENFEDIRIQWDVFGTDAQVVTIERLLRARVTSRSPKTVQGVAMWMVFIAGRRIPAAEPGLKHRTFDASYKPLYLG